MGGGRRRVAENGFTFVEIMITVMIIGIMAVWGYPALLKTLNRMKLTGIARETSIFMQKARMEAVKRGLNTEVVYLNAASSPNGLPSIFSFVDADADGAFTGGIDTPISGPHPLPKGIELRAPSEAKEGGSAIDAWDGGANPNDGPIFNLDGSTVAAGAFRFADPSDNYLEVRIEFLGTGKPTIQKYDGASWWENGENGNYWTW